MIEVFIIWGVVFVSFVFAIQSRKRSAQSLPTVPHILPWVGVAIEFGRDSVQFFSRYRHRLGPVFNVLLTGLEITMICDEEGIRNAFRDKTQAFGTYTVHQQILRKLGGVKGDAVHLMKDRLFPIILRAFGSSGGLGSISPRFNAEISTILLGRYDSQRESADTTELLSFVGHCLFDATSRAVFGGSFPTGVHPDFEVLDKHLTLLLSPIPFAARKAMRSRDRILRAIEVYIQQACKGSSLEGASPMANDMFSLIREANLPLSDEAGVLLSFMWGMHSNTINTTHWLFIYLLSDRPSFLRIRDEVDSRMATTFGGDINAFLASSSSALRVGDFPLLDSAIKETLRLTIQMSALREANKDTEVVYGDGKRAFIREGSLLFLNVGSIQNGSGPDEELCQFRLDRYLSNQKDGTAGQQPPFFAFGSGAHMCKGKAYALYQIKIFLILCVTLFDMTLLDESGRESVGDIPSSDPGTPGLARPSKRLLVRIERRLDGGDVSKGSGTTS